jgi:hypothetical protein
MPSINPIPSRSIFRPAIVRFLGALLSAVILGNSVALAAGQPGFTPDPAKWKKTLSERGIGKWVDVKAVNVSGTASGVLTAIHDDSFEVTPNGVQPITIQYSQVSEIRNRMSHRGRVWTWVVVGVIAWFVIGIVGAKTT